MKAVHFGGGNIGRGFIGQVLCENNISVTFVDVNEEIIDALNTRDSYNIEIADTGELIEISSVKGINNGKNPDAVIEAIREADIVTTAIGPKILPFIAPLIAGGIEERKLSKKTAIDIIACENMIGGSDYLKSEVLKYTTKECLDYMETSVGFPNAAVDRIVPMQQHDDSLFVSVEEYREWVIDKTMMKNEALKLVGVNYVEDLTPYIERKLFTVNTGHATVAYEGYAKGYKTILEAISHQEIETKLRAVLNETGSLMINKWDFDSKEHELYIEKIIRRFKNEKIIDDITRVARTPMRKLGRHERFIQPLVELKARELSYEAILDTIGKVFNYNCIEDEESVTLQNMLKEKVSEKVISEVTGLEDIDLVNEIKNKL